MAKLTGKQVGYTLVCLLAINGLPAQVLAVEAPPSLEAVMEAGSTGLNLDSEENIIRWRSEAQVGFLDSRGKTESRTLNGRLRVQAETIDWRNDTRANFLHTQTDDATTQESLALSHQTDYQWTHQFYSLAFAGYSFDRFKTFRHEYDVVGGLGYRIFRDADREWDLEVGAGIKYTERNPEPQEKDWSPLGRLASKFRQELSDDLEFQQEISFNRSQEVENLNIMNSFAVKANEHLAVSLSYEWRRTEDLDASEAVYDHITTLNLIYRWHP
ncbi:Protein of unknown function, DUF481 [Marinospirillum celere]|uniref:DUF481 domain-containing protein n=1 Tax=Marinospirillum celere TaxID=1122252 RepID=A0A1I1JHU6_9GAMM|nr:DUF481 domain-containing protein [Marinospirillum celere]SFC48046.1 Protein of unknown function, DUF481 [Marinospirillum celere]